MIHIPENFLDIIRAEAEAVFPNECCGLLVGTNNEAPIRVTRVVPSPNTLTDNRGGGHKNFEVDPKVHFDLLREIRNTPESNEQIIGHYHSHPGEEKAQPSTRDIDSAFEASHVWLIVGVDKNGEAKDLAAFRIDSETQNVSVVEIMAQALNAG